MLKQNRMVWIVLMFSAGCLHAFAEPFAKGPYLVIWHLLASR